MILDGLTNILNMADAQGITEEMLVKFEESGAVEEIERLQEHENNDIYRSAYTIIDTWFKEQIL